jgi:hypothetical protein
MRMMAEKVKKHPCEDCTFCLGCSESRCNMCRPSASKKKEKKDIDGDEDRNIVIKSPLTGILPVKRS